jgi:hypothetical protein
MYDFRTSRSKRRFRVKATIRQRLAASKRQIDSRLDKTKLANCSKPMFSASNIHYEMAERDRGLEKERRRERSVENLQLRKES